MEVRLCARCKKEPITLKYARYCDPCRARVRGPAPKYVWTPEKDQFLRDSYDSKIKGRAKSIAVQLGWPRWVIVKRAARLGLTRQIERKDWEPEETEFLLKHVGKRTVNWIGKKLGRSVTSVVLKTKRLKISRAFRDGYTLRRLELCFGTDHKVISKWICDGKLRAQRLLTNRPFDRWYTTDAEVLRFIIKFPQEFRLDRVDQPWFMGLILRALGQPVEVPNAVPRKLRGQAAVPPAGTECGVCNQTIEGLAIREERPSGPDGQMETWWYCQKCKAA